MKSFIKKNIKFIIIVVICITCSVLTTFATDYLFNSSEVYYNNTTSGIQADRVQGAIDELYACASNYAAYNQRLTSAENTIGSGSLTTTSQNLIGAVNGLNEQIVTLDNKVGKIKKVSAIVNYEYYTSGYFAITTPPTGVSHFNDFVWNLSATSNGYLPILRGVSEGTITFYLLSINGSSVSAITDMTKTGTLRITGITNV